VETTKGVKFALFKTALQVLLLFLALLRSQDFVGVSGPIQLGVGICHAEVKNDFRPTGPEALYEAISPWYNLSWTRRQGPVETYW
jgi:hypothetical protein